MSEKKYYNWQEVLHDAKLRLPGFVFDFIHGGAGEEQLLTHSRRVLDQLSLLPLVLRDTSVQSTTQTLFGTNYTLPIAIAPTGLNALICPGGDQLLAKAAKTIGIPFILSTAANCSISDIKTATNQPPWFQLYVVNRDSAAYLVNLAQSMECEVLVVTADVPVGGQRLRDIKNGFTLPFRLSPRILFDCMKNFSWSRSQFLARKKLSFPLMESGPLYKSADTSLFSRNFDPSISWEDISQLRRLWKGKLVIKGILHPQDALRAVDMGIDGIIVSNHGGRQLDIAPTSIEMLPYIVNAVKDKITILVDGGIRSGEDILKALALGADTVLIGRLALYGLAAEGESGVVKVLRMVQEQLLRNMSLLGCTNLEQLRNTDVVNKQVFIEKKKII
ncbi:alpha-hydroxy acid oxidase [Pedobacter lusitanus]|uniref:alpha-hydroxy acid oxidase n=1 Tax=Pedobacter lusitanus TaxID=1503925 RepID=UPI000695B6C5|nr:alpha-hydroxy acid oxidase [Pedobacter lusitanus]